MQQLNFALPDKDDFQRWLKEIKQEIIIELKKEMNSDKKTERHYLTRAQMAERFQISLVSLHHRTTQGLPSIKIGKRRLYDPVEVEKYLNSQK